MRVVVFDIDGTIADNKHRTHYLMGDKKDWKSYNAHMLDDDPIYDVIKLLKELSVLHTIILCTGREEVYRQVTWDWLDHHQISNHISGVYMRYTKDYRSDAIVKVELLNDIRNMYGEPWLWFDDRNQVVDAIRAQGVRVMQVAPGDF